MSYEQDKQGSSYDGRHHHNGHQDHRRGTRRHRDEVYSRRVPAGKRTYFFDVKSTRSGEDFFLTITESKRVGEGRYEKHKIFLYKEDFGKFVNAMHEVVQHIKEERLPDYEFRNLPELPVMDDDYAEDEYDDAYADEYEDDVYPEDEERY